jgi:hypothetical protein
MPEEHDKFIQEEELLSCVFPIFASQVYSVHSEWQSGQKTLG